MIWIDCSTDLPNALDQSRGSVTVSRNTPSPASTHIDRALAGRLGRPPSGCDTIPVVFAERLASVIGALAHTNFDGAARMVAAARLAGDCSRGTTRRDIVAQPIDHLIAHRTRNRPPPRAGYENRPCRSSPEKDMALCPFRPTVDNALREENRDRERGRRSAPSRGSPTSSSATYKAWVLPVMATSLERSGTIRTHF